MTLFNSDNDKIESQVKSGPLLRHRTQPMGTTFLLKFSLSTLYYSLVSVVVVTSDGIEKYGPLSLKIMGQE